MPISHAKYNISDRGVAEVTIYEYEVIIAALGTLENVLPRQFPMLNTTLMIIFSNFGGAEGPPAPKLNLIWIYMIIFMNIPVLYQLNTFKHDFIHVFPHSDSYQVNETLLNIISFIYSHI